LEVQLGVLLTELDKEARAAASSLFTSKKWDAYTVRLMLLLWELTTVGGSAVLGYGLQSGNTYPKALAEVEAWVRQQKSGG
jgi:hypothetical protein